MKRLWNAYGSAIVPTHVDTATLTVQIGMLDPVVMKSIPRAGASEISRNKNVCEIVWVGRAVEWVPSCFIGDMFFCLKKHPEWPKREALYQDGIGLIGDHTTYATKQLFKRSYITRNLDIMTEAAAQLTCDVLNSTERERWKQLMGR